MTTDARLVAADLMIREPNRRVIVLDDARNLLGLLCLNPSRTGFCQAPSSSEV